MEIPHILEELAYDLGDLPREAIEAAIAKRVQMTPYLLAILEDAIKRIDDIIEDDNYQGHLYAMYLLAQFREQKAYPLILQLFSFPGDIPHSIAGDVITEDLARILASVCGNHFKPLYSLIEDHSINEYVRAACQTALVLSVGCGSLSRESLISYFKLLFTEKLERKHSFVWDNLIACSCSLYPDELVTLIGWAYEQGFVDSSFMSWKEVNQVLLEEKTSRLLHLFQNAELIDDTVTEMEKWLELKTII